MKDTKYEIPITLACYGMRRSEICAVKPEDVVHINKALVLNENKKWVVKATKTTESTRDIVIPNELAEKIRLQGYIYKGHTDHVMKSVYRHSMMEKEESAKREASKRLQETLFH